MHLIELSILIVTYNSARLMESLLPHLAQEISSGLNAEVVVVDNASIDGTSEFISTHHPWVKLIPSNVNLGFAAGNNLAASQSRGQYLLLLNPDAVPEPGSMSRGLTLLKAHPETGLGGGQLIGADGSLQPSARRFPSILGEFVTMSGLSGKYPNSRLMTWLGIHNIDATHPSKVDWIPGAFVFIPARVFQSLGGFDERFFMYYEEVDLCRRMQANQLSIYFWPEIRAMHIGGESAKTVPKARVSRAGTQLESWRMRSAILYYRKQHGRLSALGFLAIEWCWHKMRQIKASCLGSKEKAEDFKIHCDQLSDAWRDTQGGFSSPPRPW